MGDQTRSDRLARTPTRSPLRVPPVSIRSLRTHGEYRTCVELQRETWGTHFNEVVSPTLLKISQRVGGVAAGAFDGSGNLLGFVFGLTGIESGRLVHWSHMLAVREAARDAGIGRRLKEYQRDVLRSLGVETVYWTFDPLVARNAHLNLNRLGADVLEYIVDMYGDTASSLHSGLGTDRFVVAWQLDRSATVSGARRSLFDPAPIAAAPVVNAVVAAENRSVPVELPLEVAPAVRVEIPPDIQETKATLPEAANAWRATTRRAFAWYLERGYRVAGFHRDRETGRSFYVLSSELSTSQVSSASRLADEASADESSPDETSPGERRDRRS